jgi:NADPH2:quinone reductase
VDLIAEMLANMNLGKDLEILAPHGQVVVIGSRGTVEINPRELMRRDAAVLGMSLMFVEPGDKLEIHAALAAGLSNGTLRPIIQRELPLAEAVQAHRLVMEGDSLGKLVLIP